VHEVLVRLGCGTFKEPECKLCFRAGSSLHS
jgi:hypothetical protein